MISFPSPSAHGRIRSPTRMIRRFGAFLVLFLCLVGGAMPGGSGTCWGKEKNFRAAVLVSREIRPYLQAAEGFEKELRSLLSVEIDRFILEEGLDDPQGALKRRISGGLYDLLIAVGPEAMTFLWETEGGTSAKRVYSMVLNPKQVVGETTCGVPLNIPVRSQLLSIASAFPSLQRLGILYDPQINAPFVEEAKEKGAPLGVTVVPLPVSSRKEIPGFLESGLGEIDGLWLIPDATVISESLVEFIIKAALKRNVPVIGYNRFFYSSGAALSFILDYEKSGEEAARLSASLLLSDKPCEEISPPFQTWLNSRVVRALGIQAVRNVSAGIEEGP
jgi:putative tryptophan/tyrosine transport system substrate-binding protein